MAAHTWYLRAEGNNAEWVHQISSDYRQADLTARDRALCDHAAKLTLTPSQLTPGDVDRLRAVGLSDRGIGDATQVIAFFNYINRLADGLGVDPEEGLPAE